MLKAAKPAGTIADFVGLLAGRTTKVATIEEINDGGGARLGGQGMKVAVDTNVLVRAALLRDSLRASYEGRQVGERVGAGPLLYSGNPAALRAMS